MPGNLSNVANALMVLSLVGGLVSSPVIKGSVASAATNSNSFSRVDECHFLDILKIPEIAGCQGSAHG